MTNTRYINDSPRPPPTTNLSMMVIQKVTKVDCIYNIAKNKHVIKLTCHQNFSLLIHKKIDCY